MRTDYGSPSALTYAGDILVNKGGESAPAKENIYPGRGVGYVGTVNNGFQHPSANKILAAGAIVASNVINGNVTIKTFDANQVEVSTTYAIAPVTYATGNDETFLLIQAAIQLLDAKLTATIDVTPTTRGITVTHSENAVILLDTWVVTLGGGQTTFSYSFDGTIVGITPRIPVEAQLDGTVYAKPTTIVYALTQGIGTVLFVDAATRASSIAIQHVANGTTKPRGAVRTTTDSGKATAFTSMKVKLGASALANGKIEINNP